MEALPRKGTGNNAVHENVVVVVLNKTVVALALRRLTAKRVPRRHTVCFYRGFPTIGYALLKNEFDATFAHVS